MKHSAVAQLQQDHLGLGPDGYQPVARHEADATTYAWEHEAIKANLLRVCPAHLWPKGAYNTACPRPILIGKQHQQQLAELNKALTAAITDIVQRWTDREARFPERMPLGKQEEELLQWLEGQVAHGNVQPYRACRGSWRPDFLVEDRKSREDGATVENFCITEINARFSFNGFMFEAYGQQALDEMGAGGHGLVGATDTEQLIGGLLGLFQPGLPLHLLKGEEHGMDIHMFIDAAQHRLGVAVRLITPADLRLIPDPQAKGGLKLCCVAKHAASLTTSEGELVEEIHQVGLELHQRELQALEPEMLRQISLRCFNDMRTVLLVHDKRMLGIVKQELQPLAARRVLTPAQAQVLDRGITDTMLPGSRELRQLVQLCNKSPELRQQYILKPVRSGKGAGIVFGEDFRHDEWLSALERLRRPGLVPGVTCVVQRRIIPRLYDVVLTASGDRLRYPLVGTYYVVHGRLAWASGVAVAIGSAQSATEDPGCVRLHAETDGGSCLAGWG